MSKINPSTGTVFKPRGKQYREKPKVIQRPEALTDKDDLSAAQLMDQFLEAMNELSGRIKNEVVTQLNQGLAGLQKQVDDLKIELKEVKRPVYALKELDKPTKKIKNKGGKKPSKK